YLNAVYYIKQQATVGVQNFYLLSKQPSSEDGVIGWVKESDLTQSSPLDHVTVDKNDKTLYLTGKGKAYAKACGCPKDLVYEDMSDFAGEAFHVNLTEKVGNNTWYRGDFKGDRKSTRLNSSHVSIS